MKVTVFHCGPAANESELRALEHLRICLQSGARKRGQVQFVRSTLRAVPANWTCPLFRRPHADLVEQEADRVTNKARKIGTTLRKVFPDLPRVDGAILLTQEPSKVKRLAGREVRGVRFSTLNDWKGALGVGSPPLLSRQQVPNLDRGRRAGLRRQTWLGHRLLECRGRQSARVGQGQK
jgi:hypothetical protein